MHRKQVLEGLTTEGANRERQTQALQRRRASGKAASQNVFQNESADSAL